MNNEQLTDKQQRFIDGYLSNGGNASKAFIDAGYKAKNENVVNVSASKLLRTTKIASRIAKIKAKDLAIRQKKQEKYEITQDWLISQLITTIEDARADKQHNVVRNSLVDIGKLVGLYVDKREINASLAIDSQLTQLDTTQLLDALQQAKQPKAIEADYREVDGDVV